MKSRTTRAVLGVLILLGPGLAWGAQSQGGPSPVRKDQASLIVDGVVREVFVSPRATRVDVLAQVEVRRAELGRPVRELGRVLIPAPGDVVYVHVFQNRPEASRGDAGYRGIPAERSQVRIYLTPRARGGGWEGTYPDWFELTARDPIPASADDPEPAAGDQPAGEPAPVKPRILGLVADPVSVGGRVALKVVEVMPGGPAQAAGIEEGDMIVDANGTATTSPEQLANAVRRSGPILKLTIRNVRTGENVPVNVELGEGR